MGGGSSYREDTVTYNSCCIYWTCT